MFTGEKVCPTDNFGKSSVYESESRSSGQEAQPTNNSRKSSAHEGQSTTRSQTNSQLVLLWRRKQSAVRANVISTYLLVWFWFCFCSGLAERIAENVVKLASTNQKALQTQNQSNHMITFDSHLKTAPYYGNCNKHTVKKNVCSCNNTNSKLNIRKLSRAPLYCFLLVYIYNIYIYIYIWRKQLTTKI